MISITIGTLMRVIDDISTLLITQPQLRIDRVTIK
jgi:hypothetical protein